ncbi:signal peptidase I [Kushneria sinocarnis]|uniref:Signal peptidase I n=1 Tax=Kushneria sinocarnis TaxID=595502 RepID=A0A420WYL6_9GAMM|nr:signal peptidase I [Kushneria sinocarnis]RKR06319.1 signal peptidase I [Kushneria sinocarnis]
MDFTLLLVLAVAVTGLVWLLDLVLLRRLRTAPGPAADHAASETAAGTSGRRRRVRAQRDPWYVDYARSFFPVLLVVLLLRSFLIEPFQIPSGSMRPTLKVGDFIVVNKFAYGLRLPVVHTRILDVGEPQRGDIMVFRFPQEPDVDFIKRVIGVPGDHIRYENKQLYVNGKPVPKELLDDAPAANPEEDLLLEHLFGRDHRIYNNPNDPGPQMREITVPPGHYFMMGDNRDHSNDSRYWGFVPENNIVGKAFAVWMHWKGGLPDFTQARLLH